MTKPKAKKLDLSYWTKRPRKDGTFRHFWQPSRELEALGYKLRRVAKHTDAELDAMREIDEINTAIKDARARGDMSVQPVAIAVDKTLSSLITDYKSTSAWEGLEPSTQVSYNSNFNHIVEVFGDVDVRAITRRQVLGFLDAFKSQPATRFAVYAAFRLLMNYGVDVLEWRDSNPAARHKIPKPDPRVVVWLPAETKLLLEQAEREGEFGLADGIELLCETGQRRGDVVSEWMLDTWLADEKIFKHAPSKTRKKTRKIVEVPATPAAAVRMEQLLARRREMKIAPTHLILQRSGQPYHPSTFSHAFDELRARVCFLQASEGEDLRAIKGESLAGFATRVSSSVATIALVNDIKDTEKLKVRDLRFAGGELLRVPALSTKHLADFRDTAVTRLARVPSMTIPMICAITGHTLEGATRILRHYMALDRDLARQAINLMIAHEAGTKL